MECRWSPQSNYSGKHSYFGFVWFQIGDGCGASVCLHGSVWFSGKEKGTGLRWYSFESENLRYSEFPRDMVLYLHSCKRKIKEWFLGWIDDFMVVFKNQFHTLFFDGLLFFWLFFLLLFSPPPTPQPPYSLYYYIGVHSNYGIFSVIHMILFSDLRDVPLWSELRADKAYDRWSCDTSWYLHAESCMCILHHLPITWCFFGRQGK